MSATFTTLYERSRYSSHGRWFGLDERERKQAIEQQERFAVGMIGFALEHDAAFRAHFLGAVCGLQDLADARGWEIFVEPENWGDLVLKHRASGFFLVAEFKIGAELKKHQDPSEARFFQRADNGKRGGYGWEIAQIAKKENWKRVKYVTVEKRASWSPVMPANHRLECEPVEWRRFIRANESAESNLETDVYDCLSCFGVSIFISRRMKQMKLASDATKPLALLIGVLAEFGAEFKPKLLYATQEFLGINVPAQDFQNFAWIVKPDGPIAGWFGYESSPREGSQLSVWFYCSRSTRKNASAKKRTKAALRKAGFQHREVHDHDSSVFVVCKAEDSTGDAEWFKKVLSAFEQLRQ